MQIFFGACLFLVAVALLVYLPGKLVLLLLKSILRPLEDFTLACVIGLLVSSLVFWLFGFAHQAHLFLLWPLATTLIFVSVRRRERKLQLDHSRTLAAHAETSLDCSGHGPHLALAGTVTLGVMILAFLPQYYTNLTWRNDGTMRVRQAQDAFLHLAIANELTHTIPPQAPIFSGHRMSYHYGMDLPVAMFSKAVGLNTRDLTFRFVPTLFLVLGQFSAFCFFRCWLRSGYFAALGVFLVFFGEDFAFIPGLLLRGQGDWSVRYFWVPTVFSLFQANPVLPGLALLFAGLLCLQRYLDERGAAWLFLSAILFAASFEVKVFIAAQIAVSLGFTSIIYLVAFRKTDLLRVAALTAVFLLPLLLLAFLNNSNEANIATAFGPWPYVSPSMAALGIPNWASTILAFVLLALPLYLFGCLGLRVIGVPGILRALFRPNQASALRFAVAFFVVIGVVITLTCRVVPRGATHPYNNSVWFFGQSKYVAWIFAAEVLQALYRRAVARGIDAALAGALIVLFAVALSVPATIQHFALQMRPPAPQALKRYDQETVGVANFLATHAPPGSVVLPGHNLLAPVLTLTSCRVPIGYFANTFVAESVYNRRKLAQDEFWKAWRRGIVRSTFLRDVGIAFVVASKQSDQIPGTLPGILSPVFANSQYAVFRVSWP